MIAIKLCEVFSCQQDPGLRNGIMIPIKVIIGDVHGGYLVNLKKLLGPKVMVGRIVKPLSWVSSELVLPLQNSTII